jgi:hypothetical protein
MPRHSLEAAQTDSGVAGEASSDEWNAPHIPIKSTANVTTVTSALPLTIAVGASLQTLLVEKIEVTCAAGNGTQLASVAAGSAGHDIAIVVVNVNAGTTTTFDITGTFSGGATSIRLPAVGAGLVGRGVRLVWSITDSNWVIDNFFNEWPARGIEVFEPIAAEPTAIAGMLQLYVKNIGGRLMPKWVGSFGVDTPVQPFMGMNRISQWQAQNGSATMLSAGYAVASATGTATIVTNAMTSIYLQMQRVEALVTVAALNTVAGWRGSVANWFIGNVASCGGFYFVMRGGPATGVATTTSNFWMGMSSNTAAPTAVEPSSVVQSIGFGYDGADTNLQIMARGAGAVTKTALTTANGTANSVIPSADRTDMFELVLFAPPNNTTVYWRVTNLKDNSQWSGSCVGTGPVAATKLAPRIMSSSMATSAVTGVSLASMYLETDY